MWERRTVFSFVEARGLAVSKITYTIGGNGTEKKLCCQILMLKRVISCKIIPNVLSYTYKDLLCARLYQNHDENAEAHREESSEDNPMVEV